MKSGRAVLLGLLALTGLAFLWLPHFWRVPKDKWGPLAAFARSQLTSFAFYGRVVDQDERPIPDADVELLPIQMGSSAGGEVHLKSDSTGFFSETGLRGIALGVNVRKSGFYLMESNDTRIGSHATFDNVLPTKKGVLQLPLQTKDAPAVFHLYKRKQIQPLVRMAKSFEMPKDGTPLVITLGTSSDQMPLKIQARLWANENELDVNKPYDWRFEITALDGKLLPRTDKWLFLAPESGYEKSTDGCEMSTEKDLKHWRRSFEKDYFIRFNNGAYGTAFVHVSPDGARLMTVIAYINPAVGSRELEAEPRRD